MSRKDRESMEELWSKRFDEEVDYEENEPMTRKAKREKEQSISPVLTVIVIFLALLIILPISAYAWFSNREDLSEEPTSPSVEQALVVEADEDDLEDDNEEELEEENEEDPTEEEPEEEFEVEETEPEETTETVEGVDSTGTETAPASQADSGSVEEASAPAQQTQNATQESEVASEQADTVQEPATEEQEAASDQQAQYYTVKAGDNMYRIALNHGLTTQELMQLNSLSEETVFIGQELRVR